MGLNELIKHAITAMVAVFATMGIVILTQPVGLPVGIVSIDATEAVLAFIRAGGKEMPDAEYETVAKVFQADLEKAIAEFAQENNVIVVNSAAVLAGAPDITRQVSEKALKSIRQSGETK